MYFDILLSSSYCLPLFHCKSVLGSSGVFFQRFDQPTCSRWESTKCTWGPPQKYWYSSFLTKMIITMTVIKITAQYVIKPQFIGWGHNSFCMVSWSHYRYYLENCLKSTLFGFPFSDHLSSNVRLVCLSPFCSLSKIIKLFWRAFSHLNTQRRFF